MKTKQILIITIILLTFIITQNVLATTYYVGQTGTPGGNYFTDGGSAVICIVVGTGNIVIDGFTITKGNSPDNGGEVNILGGYAEVLNCFITDNSAISGGGIVSMIFGIISNCVISGNTALAGGGLSAFYWFALH